LETKKRLRFGGRGNQLRIKKKKKKLHKGETEGIHPAQEGAAWGGHRTPVPRAKQNNQFSKNEGQGGQKQTKGEEKAKREKKKGNSKSEKKNRENWEAPEKEDKSRKGKRGQIPKQTKLKEEKGHVKNKPKKKTGDV